MAGALEAQEAMRSGAARLAREGTRSRFFEIPSAVHGDFGAAGASVLEEALGFVQR